MFLFLISINSDRGIQRRLIESTSIPTLDRVSGGKGSHGSHRDALNNVSSAVKEGGGSMVPLGTHTAGGHITTPVTVTKGNHSQPAAVQTAPNGTSRVIKPGGGGGISTNAPPGAIRKFLGFCASGAFHFLLLIGLFLGCSSSTSPPVITDDQPVITEKDDTTITEKDATTTKK